MALPHLAAACQKYPAIDNHAHPLLTAEHRNSFAFEGLISEAQGAALTEDAPHTLSYLRATRQLAQLYGLAADATWEQVKAAREQLPYDALVKINMAPTGIQCLLLDDGLGGVRETCESLSWHDSFTRAPTRRIVRVEIIAQDILTHLFAAQGPVLESGVEVAALFQSFAAKFRASISASGEHNDVAGFKSVACYRGGLAISPSSNPLAISTALSAVVQRFLLAPDKPIRLEDKALNDWIVCTTCEIAALCDKPVQFHTGLGDNDITLTLASPAHMQPLIAAFPQTKFVLLHSSYPYTREAGYLSAVYANVFLDFGEIFPFVSADGQRQVVRQMLELCPTNKIMWSTDGHWWPESFYLGTQQARDALYAVLAEYVARGELTEEQGVSIVEHALFHNANRIYGLGLEPAM